MTETTDRPLSGQQMAALQQRFQDTFARALDDVALRKWSVDTAIKLAEHGVTVPVIETARAIHAFLAEAVPKPPDAKSNRDPSTT